MISVQKSSPRLATSNDPIATVVDEVKIKFREIPQEASNRKDRCWQVVTAQKCGIDILKAAAIYFETYPFRKSVKILCEDKVELTLSAEVFEAFKKDSGTLRRMTDDLGVENLCLSIDSKILNEILTLLYPDIYKADVKMDIIERMTIANYLDIPHLIKVYVSQLRRKIRCFEASNYQEAHKLYDVVLASPLRTQPFMKDLIQTEFAEYFGYFLQLLGTKTPDPSVNKYVALVFEENVTDDFLFQFAGAANLTFLKINKGTKLTKWPSGFPKLETLDLRSFPLQIVTFPKNLRSLTLSYVEEQLSDLLPISNVKDLRNYPLNLEFLSLSCFCRSIQLVHVPWSLKELVLFGHITIIDLYMLPPTLFRFETESLIGIKKDNFPRTITVLKLSYHNQAPDHSASRSIGADDIKALPLIELKFANISGNGKEILDAIPETVRTLDMLDFMLNEERLKRLPFNLEALKAPIKGDNLKYLPRLRSLDLTGSQGLKDEHLKHLKPDLEELTIEECGVTNKGLAILPNGLTKLTLRKLNNITNQGIAEIPRKIKHLNLVFLSITTSCFVFMPRELEILTIFGIMLDKFNYDQLPATLEKYYTCNSIYSLNVKKIPGAKVYFI